MTIRYDHQIFSLQRQGGISRYFISLLKGFSASTETQTECPILGSINQYWQEWQGLGPWWARGQWKGQKDWGYALNDWHDARTAKRSQCQVFHPTYYALSALERLPQKPLVITIHDLTDEIHHRHLPAYQKILAQRAAHIQKADRIITVSENTRKDLLTHYPVPFSKTEMVYHGNTWENDPDPMPMTTRVERENPFLLYVGQRYAYKNFEGFCRAFAQLKARFPQWRIICTGGSPFTAAEQKQLAEARLSQFVTWVPAPHDAALKALYQSAAALVYPSLYEGFGMPILEAFSQGCPVITAQASCTAEVAGDAALLFDPQPPHDLTQCLESFLENPGLGQEKQAKGFTRAAQFSWEKTVQATAAVYQKM